MTALTLDQISREPAWTRAFARQRKDHRYYAIVEQTLKQGFVYEYLLLSGPGGQQAVQPFFVHDQDLLAGSPPAVQHWMARLRKVFPRLLTLRTLMVGCAAGEAHLDCDDPAGGAWIGQAMADGLRDLARRRRCRLVVLKEFPMQYRAALSGMKSAGFTRVPSLPMTRLNIDYADFETYMARALSKVMRKNLRRKFRATEAGPPITLEVLMDLTPFVGEAHALYMQVYDRSRLHFEKLSPEFLIRLGREMPDKVRFFLWRQDGKLIAFSLCMIQGETIYDEYLGLDYAVALELHLYFHTIRDVISWGMANGMKYYASSALNYDPKLHLKSELVPLDLYVRHTWGVANFFLGKILPWLEPTRSDPTLAKFANYADVWGKS